MRPKLAALLMGSLVGVGVAGIGAPAGATAFTLVDGEGFESPAYAPVPLAGQFASTFEGTASAPWLQSPLGGPGSAVVQSAVARTGAQSVRVDRAANSDDRWTIPITGAPASGTPIIAIEWSMRVEEATSTPVGSFGPFFGIEAYDDNSTSLLRIGSLGVDAATRDVLFTNRDVGLVESGRLVELGVWNDFLLALDFSINIYSGYLNGELLFSEGFEFAGVSGFTDADIAAIAAGFDPGSQAATGTAYFDNYLVRETNDLSTLLPTPGDFDRDGDVDDDDFGVFAGAFGGPGPLGDFDRDGDVDDDDFGVFAGNFGAAPPPSLEVPEPAAAFLLLTALAGAATRRL